MENIIKNIEGKTKDELVKLGYELELQCEDGTVAYIISDDNINLIGILQDNGTFEVDHDSEINFHESKLMKFRKIEVTQEFADMVQGYLDAENGEEHAHENASFIETLSVDFGGGIETDIKVCFERETTYIDPVLFHNGCEVCVAEVGYEILGETYFEYDGVEYLVSVVVKSDDGVNLLYASHKDRNRTVKAIEENYDVISCDEFEHDGTVFVGILYKDTEPLVKDVE